MYSDICQMEMMDGTSRKSSEFEKKSSKYTICFYPNMYTHIYVGQKYFLALVHTPYQWMTSPIRTTYSLSNVSLNP